MANSFHAVVQVPDRSYQGLAKIELREIAVEAGFAGHRLGEVEIVISEIVTNLVKHAKNGGIILCRILEEPQKKGVELIAIDNGPGMSVARKMMQDGYSTSSTLGQGLGAIQRQSDEFDLYSLKDWGTILFSRIYLVKKEIRKETEGLVAETLRVAKHGEKACGDNWALFNKNRQYRMVVADGLGHGPDASAAATSALRSMEEHLLLPPNELLRRIHDDIRKTRGAVMAIVNIDVYNKQLTYCGVGNISCKLVHPAMDASARTFNSYNGIVGYTMPNTTNNNVYPWDNKYDVLVMHSDGLSTRWDISKYPNIFKHHGMILCAALYKDHNRGNDDTTVSVIRSTKSLS